MSSWRMRTSLRVAKQPLEARRSAAGPIKRSFMVRRGTGETGVRPQVPRTESPVTLEMGSDPEFPSPGTSNLAEAIIAAVQLSQL